MPGPYDLSYQDETFSQRLPFGIGSDNIAVALWPELALMGGASLLSRAGVRHAMGKSMMGRGGKGFLGLFGGEGDMMKRARGIMSGRGSTASRVGRLTEALGVEQRARGLHRTTPAGVGYQKIGDLTEWRNPRPGRVVPGTGPAARTRQAFPKGHTEFLGSRVELRAPGPGGSSVRTSKTRVKGLIRAHRKTKAAELGLRAAKGAGMMHFAGMARGLGVGLVAAQTVAFGLDIAKMTGEAALDWSPRQDKPSPHEFGHVFYDPRGAYTQRQRAIAAIHDSQLTTRAALGGEAAFMHS